MRRDTIASTATKARNYSLVFLAERFSIRVARARERPLHLLRPAMPSSRLLSFSSSVGTKLLIGVTGLALFLYLILHIVGNALVFLGPDVFNEYSHALI